MAADSAGDPGEDLQTSLEIDGKTCIVTLTKYHLSWHTETRDKSGFTQSSERQAKYKSSSNVKMHEIVAVHAERGAEPTGSCSHRGSGSGACCKCLEMMPLSPSAFSVHYAVRQPKHKWRVKNTLFRCADAELCKQWVDAIQKRLNTNDLSRPKKLLVFVNPFGGKKKGPKIYREKVAPLFDLAGVSTDVIITESAGHAKNHIRETDLSRYDGLVCVGGDGMFSELLNGLLDRCQLEAGIPQSLHHHPARPRLRIGIIPAGSTDAVVYTTTGTNDPVSSTLHIILGESVGIDVTGVYHDDQFITYNVSMLAYGYYGDVLADSETNRWMGPKRYDWSGFKKVLANKGYAGEVSFVLSQNEDTHPQDGTRCYAGCEVCREAYGRLGTLTGEINTESDKTPEWHTIRGRFMGLNTLVMSCRCGLSPEGPSPTCHLGDGCADLTVVRHGPRFSHIKHLYRCTTKKSDQFDLPLVQVHRVREFRFRAMAEDGGMDTQTSVWNCDGEVIHTPNLDVKIYCQLVRLFAKGIEENQHRDTSDLGSCGKCV